ncbi:MAG: HDOD domain-containing protein [Lentisphaeraceae bacterium]|nr:HDOD domain-containing protein [Lentisphaeraceae bacterium]
MSEIIRKKILQSIDDMPSLPLTALKILRLANDINSSPQEMLETIKVDPVITGKVLQMINSSYFGLSTTVSDLRQALVMLGSNTVKNLALTSALLNTMKSKGSGHAMLDLDGLWLHSLATAVGAKIIARTANLPRMQHDEFFIIGLLHDIGRIFSFQFLANEYVEAIELAKSDSLDITVAETSILSMTAPEAGGLLAEKWQLPGNMLNGIRYYRTPAEAGDFQKICSIVNIASYFATQKNIGWSDDLAVHEPSESILEVAGVSLEELTDPLTVMEEEIEKAKSFIQE